MDIEALRQSVVDGAGMTVPWLGGGELEVMCNDDPLSDKMLSAVAELLTKHATEKETIAPHLYAYFQDMVEAVGMAALREEGPQPTGLTDIWSHVWFGSLLLAEDWGTPYTMLIGGCSWEPEHGLCLSYRGGKTLSMVSGFTGHPTQDYRNSADAEAGYIYYSKNPKFRTRA